MVLFAGKSFARISTEPITWPWCTIARSNDQCAGDICARWAQRNWAGLLWASKSQPKACSGISGPKISAGGDIGDGEDVFITHGAQGYFLTAVVCCDF